MMDDRELLELVAKAAEIKLFVWGKKGQENFADVSDVNKPRPWNPLTNNGDAFRLAVKLRMNVFHTDKSTYALPFDEDKNYEIKIRYADTKDDPYAATRLAIVRAAAESGRSMP